uniref:Probable RNA polymerase II nuclear localization protein SLC7A6OS n=1 Tax=Ditylenchus dipsaci TaxID=166011 RepID=A0A915D8X8_9BILA
MKAARAISDFGLDEKEKQEFEKACTAPLAQVESMMDGAVGEEIGEPNKDYVYDFYWSNPTGISSSKAQQQKISSSDTLEVRLPTDEELQLFYGGENGDSDEQDDNDSQDSNAENNYRNDYPDEDEFNRSDQNENESTSDDDYDHYGDEAVNYDSSVRNNNSDSD